MSDPVFSSRLDVLLDDYMGSDFKTVRAATQSTLKAAETRDPERFNRRLLNDRHTGPLEHNVITFILRAPIFVARQWMRHRTQSFSEQSGRYVIMPGEFYLPPPERPLGQEGATMDYKMVHVEDDQREAILAAKRQSIEAAWMSYETQLLLGASKEVARMELPLSTYTQWWATANLLNWMRFLSLRVEASNSLFATHPQWEINQMAAKVEQQLRNIFPNAIDAWNTRGRY